MLYNGEHVGDGTGPKCDVAVDPVDGTTLTAKGMPNAVAVMAVSPRGSMYDPSAVFYMEKLVDRPRGGRRRRHPAPRRGEHPAHGQGQGQQQGRHHRRACSTGRATSELVDEIRATGARIKFILDGDVAGAIMAARPDTGIDLMLGVGGTPEGIIAACAMKALGGVIQGRLWPTDDEEEQRRSTPATTSSAVLSTDELVTGDDCFFVATGITDGELLRGVRYAHFTATTHSLVMRSRSGTIRTHHQRAPVRQAAALLPRRLRAGLRASVAHRRPAPQIYWWVTTRSRRRSAGGGDHRRTQHRGRSSHAELGHRARYDTFGDRDDPGAAAHHGPGRSADLVGPRALRAVRRARLLRHPLRQPRRRPVDQAARPRRSTRRDVVRGFVRRQTSAALHAERHGRRRRRPARPPRRRQGPRHRGLDGRHDRADARHRAPRPGAARWSRSCRRPGARSVGWQDPRLFPCLLGRGRAHPRARPSSGRSRPGDDRLARPTRRRPTRPASAPARPSTAASARPAWSGRCRRSWRSPTAPGALHDVRRPDARHPRPRPTGSCTCPAAGRPRAPSPAPSCC